MVKIIQGHTLSNTAHILRVLRLALSGGIAGAALATILSRALGLPDGATGELIGAALGFLAVATVKATHLI